MLHLDIIFANIIAEFIRCDSIEEFVIQHRNNRQKKEFFIFDIGEMNFLNREKGIPSETIKQFAETIFLLSKESLMVP
jgi:hypothetical protein